MNAVTGAVCTTIYVALLTTLAISHGGVRIGGGGFGFLVAVDAFPIEHFSRRQRTTRTLAFSLGDNAPSQLQAYVIPAQHAFKCTDVHTWRTCS
jgi:hypothetical protein